MKHQNVSVRDWRNKLNTNKNGKFIQKGSKYFQDFIVYQKILNIDLVTKQNQLRRNTCFKYIFPFSLNIFALTFNFFPLFVRVFFYYNHALKCVTIIYKTKCYIIDFYLFLDHVCDFQGIFLKFSHFYIIFYNGWKKITSYLPSYFTLLYYIIFKTSLLPRFARETLLDLRFIGMCPY